MAAGITFPGIGSLISRQASALLPEQVERFTWKSLRAKPVRPFDVRRSLQGLRQQHGKTVIAVDIGGDKLTASSFTVEGGILRASGDIVTRQGDGGAGYLDALRELRDFARARNLPVGISFAGPTSGTRILAAPNLSLFMREFQNLYGGDFAGLFPAVELANDAEAGLMSGAMEAVTRFSGASDVIYVINGSGLGGAALVGNTIYAAEPGHIAVVGRLNSFGRFSQRKQCGLDGAAHVCVEAVGASKAGVEDIWRQVTGEHLTGRAISDLSATGNDLACALYHNSASITAHVVAGMASAFGLLSAARRPVVVFHGGIFHSPGYGERVLAMLARGLRPVPSAIFTKDFSSNTCLEGAAIAAAVKDG